MIKKSEFINRILEIIKKDLEKRLPEEAFLYEYQDYFKNYREEKHKCKR